jgi:hypothetical protein
VGGAAVADVRAKREARALRYERAITFVCLCCGKARYQLTVDDLAQAQKQAVRDNDGDVYRSLNILIQFRGVREVYFRPRDH